MTVGNPRRSSASSGQHSFCCGSCGGAAKKDMQPSLALAEDRCIAVLPTQKKRPIKQSNHNTNTYCSQGGHLRGHERPAHRDAKSNAEKSWQNKFPLPCLHERCYKIIIPLLPLQGGDDAPSCQRAQLDFQQRDLEEAERAQDYCDLSY